MLVGLPDTAVREAKDRVRAAMASSGYHFPSRRVTVNLAPAKLRGYQSAASCGALGLTRSQLGFLITAKVLAGPEVLPWMAGLCRGSLGWPLPRHLRR